MLGARVNVIVYMVQLCTSEYSQQLWGGGNKISRWLGVKIPFWIQGGSATATSRFQSLENENNSGYTQNNSAVSKVNKKFISHLTRAQRTSSAAATVQVFHTLPAVRFSCLLRGHGASFQDGVAAGKGFLCAPFWGVQICDYSAAWVSCTV